MQVIVGKIFLNKKTSGRERVFCCNRRKIVVDSTRLEIIWRAIMKKIHLIGLSSAVVLAMGSMASAQDSGFLEEVLSMQYGAPVKIEIDEQKCQLTYPKTEIVEEVAQSTNLPGGTQQAEQETKVITIPETVISCSKTDDFNGFAQYKAVNSSPNKIIAQFYNSTTLSILKDVDFKTYEEEFSFVPELGFVSASKVHVADAAYTVTDETTGLKSELGHLKDLLVTQNIEQNGQTVKYKTDADMDLLNIAMPFFSVQVKSEHQAAEVIFDMPDSKNDIFDYTAIWSNFAYLTSSKSRAVGQGIKVDVSMLGFVTSFDVDTKSDVQKNASGMLDFDGTFLAKNIKTDGVDIGAAKNLNTLGMKYTIKDINIQSAVKFLEMQQKMQKGQNVDIDESEIAKLMDDMVDKAKIDMSMKAVYPNAEMSVHSNFVRRNDYLTGNAEINVKNLYNIFPEQKRCLNNQAAQQEADCAMFAGLGQYVDLSKDSFSIVFKFTEQGIFRGNEKIGDPIEFNFQKMQRENALKQQEQEERMKQLMQDSEAMSDLNALGLE